MKILQNKHLSTTKSFLKWSFYGGIVGILCGMASAIFLHGLDWVTDVRENHKEIIYFLPIAGVFTSYLYMKFGKNSSRGNNLILEEIQNKKEEVPLRMGGLVLISTLISHLFGASVGREGTAVQMGGSFASTIAKIFKLNERDRKIILMSGISGGFGSVFGTPLAGAIFGMEVSAIGAIKYEALIPCFMASFIGDIVTQALFVHHTKYMIGAVPTVTIIVLVKVLIASAVFGIVAAIFSEAIHFFKRVFAKYIKNPLLRPFVGGVIVIVLTAIVGTSIFNGIGVKTIKDAFTVGVNPLTFAGKILFTSLSLGSGFQGGEVTPLFYVGATLGDTLSGILDLPMAFLAGLGLIGVFAGASNTPIACFILGIELFGSEGMVYFFIVSILSYMFSGHRGIYTSQMVATAKSKLLHEQEGKKIGEL